MGNSEGEYAKMLHLITMVLPMVSIFGPSNNYNMMIATAASFHHHHHHQNQHTLTASFIPQRSGPPVAVGGHKRSTLQRNQLHHFSGMHEELIRSGNNDPDRNILSLHRSSSHSDQLGSSSSSRSSTSLAYSRGSKNLMIDEEKDELTSKSDDRNESGPSISNNQDSVPIVVLDDVYSLGLKPVIIKPGKEHNRIALKDDTTKPTPNSYTLSIAKTNDKSVQHGCDNDGDKDLNSFNIAEVLFDKSGNYTWSTTENDKLIDMITSTNETKREMEYLLNITMPSPTDYISKSLYMNQEEKNLVAVPTEQKRKRSGRVGTSDSVNDESSSSSSTKKNNDDLSSLALSLMDALIEATPQNGIETLLNMTKSIPLDLDSSSSLSSSSSSSMRLNGKKSTNNATKESSDPASLDLYSIATSLMTNPPKMKRTKPTKQPSLTPYITIPKSPSSSKSKSIKLTSKQDPNAPITLNDLQRILNENGYIRRDELSNITSTIQSSQSQNKTKTKKETDKKTKGGLAFPQSSVLNSKHIRVGTSISSSFFALLIAVSLQPNLWLVGSIVGAILGNDIAMKKERLSSMNDGEDDVTITPAGLYGDVSMKVGTRIARGYLNVKDFVSGIWFMYRTGQLSYQYYKTYESLDQKFRIQEKMDMWNARFVEGKQNFDKWEQENEIGRKVLAGLRTAWMLEENSYRNQRYRIQGRGVSKYRVVQYAKDTFAWFKKLFIAVWDAITGGGSSELKDIIKGVKIQITELRLDVISQRMGAALAALLAVNIVGAMFAMTPSVLGAIALVSGLIWPDWVSAAYQHLKDVIDESRARGRGEGKHVSKDKKKADTPLIDKNNFNFFVKENGRKQWYRTGQSMFAKFEDEKVKGIFNFLQHKNKKPKHRNNWERFKNRMT